ncbi:G-protein coupled receptor 84 [Narcine bancroftii]|uniref:G-protein coupled receptor 84 n=1 Tax=Narcine bancroftii TaxID=1343680 RepID=UPI00383158F8
MNANLTWDNNTCHPDVYGYRYFGAFLGIGVTVVGTVGNLMTLLAFATDSHLRTRFNLLILNLTVSDLIYCGFLQPVTVDTFLHFTWRQSRLMCQIFGLILFEANAVSIFNLVLIAATRYLLISDPQRFERLYTWRTVPWVLALPWALGLALFGPLWNIYVFLPVVCTCSFHRSRGRPYTTVLMFLMFGFGLSTIGIFYYLISRKVRSVAKALQQYRRDQGADVPAKKKKQQRVSGVPSSDSGLAPEPNPSQVTEDTSVGEQPLASVGGAEKARPSPATASQPNQSTKKEFSKVTRMCFAMFLVYVACYFPFCILHVADGKKRAPILLHMVAGNFTWLNSCLNPVLYAVMNRQFRTAYWGVLTRGVALLTRCFRSCRT